MSTAPATTDQPGFMGAPSKSVDEFIAPPQADPGGDRDFDACLSFELPETVMESVHWAGKDADRFFVLAEPTVGQMRDLAKREQRNFEAVVQFIRGIGVPDATGKISRGEVSDDYPEGRPMFRLIGYAEAVMWHNRLGPKGSGMVTGEWAKLIQPTATEADFLSRSRRRV